MSLTVDVDGVLFDNDGVLVDSLSGAMEVWQRWALAWSPTVDPTVDFPHGTPARDIIGTLVVAEHLDDASAALDQMELTETGPVDTIPGAAEPTAPLPEGRWVVVSSASRELATLRLQQAGYRPSHVVGVDDVTRGKPDPEPYLRGAELFGSDPSTLVVFEDAAVGVQAARAASVGYVIGVGASLDPALVDALVPDLRSVRRVTSDKGTRLQIDGPEAQRHG